tara:strand:+ start:300 stop:452 length:153 start_codon:yes stop_codon:yes gene_type:complete
MKWDYHWTIRDDGLIIYEDGKKIAKIDTDHFKHMIAEMAQHLRWVEERKK